MKKLLLQLACFFALCSASYSQGTLQFNQVLLFNTTAVQTVPAGKVWKIEHFLAQGTFKFDYVNSAACSTGRFSGMLINGVTYFPKQFGISNTGSSPVSVFGVNGGLWLPAGTTLALQCTNDLISLLEFNVVP